MIMAFYSYAVLTRTLYRLYIEERFYKKKTCDKSAPYMILPK